MKTAPGFRTMPIAATRVRTACMLTSFHYPGIADPAASVAQGDGCG